jgi:predicted dehydrogenase
MTSNAIFRWSNAEGLLRYQSPECEIIINRLPEGFERNDLFLNHMAHFLKRLDSSALPPLCKFEDGVAALQVALAAREANSLGKMVKI